MKPLIVAGWGVLALEALFVLMLALQKNMGDDAAGRGMATGFAMLLAPIVLGAAALLLWGTRGGPAPVTWLALAVIFAPLAWGALNMATGGLKSLDRAFGRAQQGRFDDARLTTLSRAITRGDHAALRSGLAGPAPDWTARDRWGRTLLGHAVVTATAYDAQPSAVDAVRSLLQAGAPPALDALAARRTPGSVSEHNLVYHLYGMHNPAALAVLDLVLAAGASPDQVDEDQRPLYFSTYTVLPALQVLARHGADFRRLDPRSDRRGRNALMNAVSMQLWAEALFFLQQGVPVDTVAEDGSTLRSILAEVDPPGSTYHGDDEARHAEFMAELGRRGVLLR